MSVEHLKLVEMVGICGAGKSSLRKALQKSDPRFVFLGSPGKLFYIPFFFKSLLYWFILYIRKYRHTRWFSSEEIRSMAYLECWMPHLTSNPTQEDRIVILDPGFVYWLSDLNEFGAEITRSPEFEKWWDAMFERWSQAVDAIIWLDAPDPMLYDRVKKRHVYHPVKDQTQPEAAATFGRLRLWYSKIIQRIVSQREIKVFKYQTDQVSTEQMRREILAQLALPKKNQSPLEIHPQFEHR